MEDARPLDYLHAYWRMEYIEAPQGKKNNNDLFNYIAENPHLDEEHLVLHRSQYSYIMLNKFPYNAGHLLTVPYQPVPFLSDLSTPQLNDLMEMISFAQSLLLKTLKPDGFNIGFNLGSAAGAGIPQHLHCHIVPRWNGDTNFMPVIASTKVLPTALHEMWKRLNSEKSL